MTAERGDRLELLIAGFVRNHEKKYELYMTVPYEITIIMHELYPLLLFGFGDYKKDKFLTKDNKRCLMGTDDCAGYMVYADLGQYNDIGLNKGIHLWSLRSFAIDSGRCYLSIGVTTEKNDKVINDWNSAKIRKRNHWIEDGYNSHFEGNPRISETGAWLYGEVITAKLDCDQWKVTYFRNNEEIQQDEIEPNQSYYFALMCCANSSYSVLKVVEK